MGIQQFLRQLQPDWENTAGGLRPDWGLKG